MNWGGRWLRLSSLTRACWRLRFRPATLLCPVRVDEVSGDPPETAREGACAPHTLVLSAAISSMVHPVSAETSARSLVSRLFALCALVTSHFVFPFCVSVRVSVHAPRSFFPLRKTVSPPFQ